MSKRPLVQPILPPCPQNAQESAPQGPVKPPVDYSGYDCCEYYDKHYKLHKDVVSVNHVDPERFKYDQYRYQLYAKPAVFDCHSGKTNGSNKTQKIAAPRYVPAYTDVRALEQTMYIPVVPSNPGGETEVTFPMTPQTMGQPDVTSACCVPVIPSQPGFKNMTQGILPGPCQALRADERKRDWYGTCGNASCRGQTDNMGAQTCPSQFMGTPSNVPGNSFVGLPDTFPSMSSNNSCSYSDKRTPVSTLHPPHYTGALPSDQSDWDGMSNDKVCVNSSAVKYTDRVQRAIQSSQETPAERYGRLKMVYGSYGSFILGEPKIKRYDVGYKTDALVLQGNGFQWNYTKHPNRQCYVLERNVRC